MTRPRCSAPPVRRAPPWWRSQRGEAVSALLVLCAFVLEGIAIVVAAAVGAAGVSTQDRQRLSACLRYVNDAAAELRQKYGPGGEIPPDDPNVLAIKDCKVLLDSVKTQLGTGGGRQNLTTAIGDALQDLGRCRVLSVTPASPVAGITRSLFVKATVPLTGAAVSGTITVATGGSPLSGSFLAPAKGFDGSGTVAIPESVSRDAAGNVHEVTVSAQSNLGPVTDGRCPGFIPPTGDQCILSCASSPFPVLWRNPDLPQISIFRAVPSSVVRGRVDPVFLVWKVVNAKSITIDQGIGEVDKSGTWIDVPPDDDLTYTLTAEGVRAEDTRTATARVTVTEPPSLTLTSPANNAGVAADAVTVSGTLSPPIPNAMVAISVNGLAPTTVAVDGAGQFSTAVPLDKKLTFNDVTLTNPNFSVTTCGTKQSDVVLAVGKSTPDVTNVISVSAVGFSPPVTASATVFHVVRVTRFFVTWGSECPPLNKDDQVDRIVGAGQSVTVGNVNCGVTNPEGFIMNCSVTAGIDTLGPLAGASDIATWSFNVPSCPP